MQPYNHISKDPPARKNINPKLLFFQPKLTINTPGDPYEKEADVMAEKVMRMPDPHDSRETDLFFAPSAVTPVQRKCDHCKEEEPASAGTLVDRMKMQRKDLNEEDATTGGDLENYMETPGGRGQALPKNALDFYEPRFGYDLSKVKIHTGTVAARSAQAVNAHAYTSGNHIVFNEGQYNLQTDGGKRLLAHELTHVIQQNNSLNQNIIQRQPDKKRPQTPHDKATVAAAKAKLAKLEPLLQQAEDRSLAIEAERLRVLADRKRMDDNAADLAMPSKRAAEEYNIANLNRDAVKITQTKTDIIFSVQFQVLFNDPAMKSRFGDVKKNMQAGIDLVWKQTLTGDVFGGRKFTIIPSFSLIDSYGGRDLKTWLINIRKSDTEKVSYPGCSLPQPDPGIPTSVTDSTCNGGVMSIPPLHIGKPGVLGHEMLHLFGLIDRYFTVTSVEPSGKKIFEDEPVRDTGKRKDPLGGQDGTILREDLGYLFDELGVYKKENLSNEVVISSLRAEVMRLKRIVELGYDPDSLIRIRENFDDRMIKDAENL